jgi:hypothetical protein
MLSETEAAIRKLSRTHATSDGPELAVNLQIRRVLLIIPPGRSREVPLPSSGGKARLAAPESRGPIASWGLRASAPG